MCNERLKRGEIKVNQYNYADIKLQLNVGKCTTNKKIRAQLWNKQIF